MAIRFNFPCFLWVLLFMLRGVQTAAAGAPTFYVIQPASSNTALNVCVQRSAGVATTLSLRGAMSGISAQVRALTCDGIFLANNGQGSWAVPDTCVAICWDVPLLDSHETIASAGQSVKRGNFIVLSELSSLPRFADADETQTFVVVSAPVQRVVPAVNAGGAVPFPPLSAAPLLLVLDATVVDRVSNDAVTLTYFIDDPNQACVLPRIEAHMIGVAWLHTLFTSVHENIFNIAWVGTSARHQGIAGMAGHEVLVANYPADGAAPFGDAMLLYVALHEAVHQLAPFQALWMGESLASYYGARATQMALPNDPRPAALCDRFRAGAAAFSDGLLEVNRQVVGGQLARYGAFYTKGLVFWAEVDKILQRQRGIRLDDVLPALLDSLNVSDNTAPVRDALGLSPDSWEFLSREFLR